MCTICFFRNATKSGTWSNGNKNARGSIGNAGNMKKGRTKKRAGHRSGIKRSAKYALVVKKQWLDLILARERDWEIRGCATNRCGWIHFAESQAGGKLMGRARLVNCATLQRRSFQTRYVHHGVSDMDFNNCSMWRAGDNCWIYFLEMAVRRDAPPDPFIHISLSQSRLSAKVVINSKGRVGEAHVNSHALSPHCVPRPRPN